MKLQPQTVPRAYGVVAPERSGRLTNSIYDRVSVLNTYYSFVRFWSKLNKLQIADGPRDYGVNVVYNSLIIIYRLYYGTRHNNITKTVKRLMLCISTVRREIFLETINQSPWTHIYFLIWKPCSPGAVTQPEVHYDVCWSTTIDGKHFAYFYDTRWIDVNNNRRISIT